MGLFFFGVLLTLVSLFLMLLILVQRGKGGGLTGALGGMGGQSAFGARAGDTFTKVTTITAIVWITLCMLTIALFNPPPREVSTDQTNENIPSDISGAMTGGEEEEAAGDEVELDLSGESDPEGSDPNVLPLDELKQSNDAELELGNETDTSTEEGGGGDSAGQESSSGAEGGNGESKGDSGSGTDG